MTKFASILFAATLAGLSLAAAAEEEATSPQADTSATASSEQQPVASDPAPAGDSQ